MIHSLARRLPFFYGWVVVGCTMCSGVVRQVAAVATLSIFLVPMTDEFGWSRTGISGAVSLGGVLGAFVAPFIGPLFDRHGSRALLIASAVTVSGCCIALAGTQGLLWFYVAFSISRMMFSAPFEIGTTSAVTKWFVRGRARAMSLLVMSTGVGLTVLPLVVAAAVAVVGWRAGWVTLAVIAIVLGVIPQWLLLVRRPEDIGLRPDGVGAGPESPVSTARLPAANEVSFTRARALRTSTLWLLMAYTLLVFPVQAGVSLHQAPHLIERGISATIAATIVSTFSLAAVLASLLFGYIGERMVSVRMCLAASAALLALGAATMRGVEGPLLGYVSAGLFGAGIGGILTMIPVAWANYFGRAHFGAIRGITLPAQVGGQAVGPLAAGVLHDLTGSYASGLTAFAVLSLIAAGLALITRAPRRP
ncbi:MAG: MFS transporter [Thiotrichales bacterium]|nr:MFS transporter [Thiotrichales bacterium]